MRGSDIRQKFLRFFEEKGHRILPSASLIPFGDPSILWTAAGMVPFKPYFTGAASPPTTRVTTCQKCLRTPDIESVGKTARHHTFFEMLGNFSFGDYFKQEAISWSWEFVTRVLGLDPGALWVSIYLDDDEAYEIWHGTIGVPDSRIVRLGKEDNFWEIGVGPCGPCSEIYVDLGPKRGCQKPDCGVGCDCDRYLEIWNLVFIQFFRDEDGNYSPLEQKGIDTGMGLERVASVLQGVESNFDTDLFREIMDKVAAHLGVAYGKHEKTDVALKVIADHARAVTFAVADGALPSNEGRGYVIRRLIRRAVRFGRLLGQERPFLDMAVRAVIRQMGDVYPELVERKEHILDVVSGEERRFLETLEQGSDILEGVIKKSRDIGVLSGKDAFKLYDTYGFPLELTQEIVAEKGLTVDVQGFKEAMEAQRERSREARGKTEYLTEQEDNFRKLRQSLGETGFLGYDRLSADAFVRAVLVDGLLVDAAGPNDVVEFILDETPCYAQSGGQVADTALVSGPGLLVEVEAVERPVENLIVHRGRVIQGTLKINDRVTVSVDTRRRQSTARNHSATHLLHRALRDVLGGHVNQAGSLVTPDRLRFDFTHHSALSPKQLRQIEKDVNQAILQAMAVETSETSLQEARALGAMALFDEKYGDKVRLVRMGDYSLELCGGTHVKNTAEIGFFKLIGEGGIGAGVRRVEAVTGEKAVLLVEERDEILSCLSDMLKAAPGDLKDRMEGLLRSQKEMEREMENLQATIARQEVNTLLTGVREINGVKMLAARVSAKDMDALRAMVDLLRDRLPATVILLGSVKENKVNMVASVGDGLCERGLHAGKIIREVAAMVGGSGGGRPQMAQAGGKNPARLDEAIERSYGIAASLMQN